MKKVMKIDGMMCSHCTGTVTKVLNAIDGVTADVSLEDKCAYITLDKAMALGAGMGGGVRCGSICGAVSAPVMLLGTACPDPTDRPAVTAVVKEYQRRFTERFHRLDCRELLRAQDLEPSELALELAGSDHCGRLIVTAAELLTDMLEEA